MFVSTRQGIFYVLVAWRISADIYDETCEELAKLNFDSECVGGGRIEHRPGEKSIKIYGYSQMMVEYSNSEFSYYPKFLFFPFSGIILYTVEI
ncbi:unnamed protein product [Nesidiocoris tenuis]|uniref:Uncharacterized protein n=1 Tax=Nesidiocoris tenuis TaxID=355587 RepID=A0A6H5GUS7_9HEMI|nr:unnamed protein product [Nesidiocoris tenuis]